MLYAAKLTIALDNGKRKHVSQGEKSGLWGRSTCVDSIASSYPTSQALFFTVLLLFSVL